MNSGGFGIVLMLLAGLCSAQEQEPHKDIPSFAHYSAGEQGWSCDDGFKQVAGFCVRENEGPSNESGLEVYQGEWRCRPGYKRTNGVCALPTAPEHASLVDGERWECDWGYKKVAARCEEITPPAHAYLDAEGRDWACYPGYERESDHCVRTAAADKKAPPEHSDEPRRPDEPPPAAPVSPQ
jgi:hypothetical protein